MPSLTTPSRTYSGVVNEHTAPDKNWNYFSPIQHEKNKPETGVGCGRQTREVIQRQRQRLGLEAAVRAAEEDIGNDVQPRLLVYVVAHHKDLPDDLRHTAQQNDVERAEPVADHGSGLAKCNFRH